MIRKRRAVYSTTFQRVLVFSFIGPLDVDDVDAAFIAFDDLRREVGAPCGAIALLGPANGMLDDATRRRVADWQQRLAPHLLASALVVDAEGFVASLVRLTLGSVRLLERRNYRERTFATIPEGTKWLGGFLDLDLREEAELIALARAVRREHQALRANG